MDWGFSGAKKERRGRRAELPEEVAKKLKSCSVIGCEEWRDLAAPTTYHCFPTGDKNQQRWEIWTSLLQKAREDENWIPFRGSLVCSHHFITSDFVQDPHQKRTKLVKNAIPSIFPTFTVDLQDPTYFLEDSEDDNNNGAIATDTDNYKNYYEDYTWGDDEYSYEDNNQTEDTEFVTAEVQYDDDEEEEVEYETSYAQATETNRSVNNNSKARPLPTLTPATHFRKSQEYEPPKKKNNFIGQGSNIMSKKPPLTFKGKSSSGNTNSTINSTSSNSTFQSSSTSSKLYQQLCKSAPNGKFPMSWNNDLEIEIIEPMSNESVSSLKQRVEELETENETLKQKFGAQIRALQRKIKEQEKVIHENIPAQRNQNNFMKRQNMS